MVSNRYLRRTEASAPLKQALGVTVAEATLAKMTCLGHGPPVEYFGRVPVYREDRLLDWGRSRIGAIPRHLGAATASVA
jgi:hypothetical protein